MVTEVSPTILEQIVELLVVAAKPRRIIIFGSYARGEQAPDSDLDLLVTEDVVPDPAREQVRLRRVLGDIDLPIDVLVLREQEVSTPQRWLGTAIYDALLEGRELYAAEQHR
jgi:predicted nucleotidyltransferase